MKLAVLLLAAMISFSFAQETDTDSLKRELDLINKKLDLYKTKDEAIQKAKADLHNDEKSKEKRVKAPGVGGSGGITIGLKAIDMTPIKESIAFDKKRRGENSVYHNLNIDEKLKGQYETFFISGGQGLVGLGNGVRIGGGLYGGGRTYRIWNDMEDSLYNMASWVGYGGFTLEKSFGSDNVNFLIGTNIGAGSQGVVLWNSDEDFYTEATNNDSTTVITVTSNDRGVDWSVFFSNEIHTGVTYSFLPWFHIGLEFSGALFVSGAGFKNGVNYTTFNPGGNLRIMFGRVS